MMDKWTQKLQPLTWLLVFSHNYFYNIVYFLYYHCYRIIIFITVPGQPTLLIIKVINIINITVKNYFSNLNKIVIKLLLRHAW